MIRAIDMVIGFPKGLDGAYNHVRRGVTGGSVSRGVLNDDGGAMLATSRNVKSRTIGARHSASTCCLGAVRKFSTPNATQSTWGRQT
jgi:hypothetical protein